MSDFYPQKPAMEDSEKEKAIAKALRDLTSYFKDITEFSERELKAISLLSTDKYLSEMVEQYILNKKHVKRKHSKEILKALELCTKESSTNKKLLDTLLHRERY